MKAYKTQAPMVSASALRIASDQSAKARRDLLYSTSRSAAVLLVLVKRFTIALYRSFGRTRA